MIQDLGKDSFQPHKNKGSVRILHINELHPSLQPPMDRRPIAVISAQKAGHAPSQKSTISSLWVKKYSANLLNAKA